MELCPRAGIVPTAAAVGYDVSSLAGLLSLMDAILEIPMASLLAGIALSQETKAVLLGEANRLRPLYLLVLALESGECQNASTLTKQLHL